MGEIPQNRFCHKTHKLCEWIQNLLLIKHVYSIVAKEEEQKGIIYEGKEQVRTLIVQEEVYKAPRF